MDNKPTLDFLELRFFGRKIHPLWVLAVGGILLVFFQGVIGILGFALVFGALMYLLRDLVTKFKNKNKPDF